MSFNSPNVTVVAKGVAHRELPQELTREQLLAGLEAAMKALEFIRDMTITIEHADGSATVYRELVSRIEAKWGLENVVRAIQVRAPPPDTPPETPVPL